ncbi:MAG: hypothetical protein M3340_01255 [Actinomycetota bacterium]|nr:hypothetical protein [Actinomycetota bacterium]
MLDLEIRQRIADYNDGRIEAAELEAWLVEATAEVESEPRSVRDLAFEVMALLTERGNGDWEDSELRERLGALSRNYWFAQAPKHIVSDSNTTFIRHDRRPAASDRRRAAEFA